ncbi:MAG: PAS domain-containing protein, partial [Pyrinomonadaceae bacterium]
MPDTAFKTDFHRLFETVPGLYIVLNPDLTVVAVTDEFLRATFLKREDAIGRFVFDIFPDNTEDGGSNNLAVVRASFEKVFATGKPDALPLIKYDVQRPLESGGGFAEKFWRLVTFPGFDENGKVSHIIHRIEDITTRKMTEDILRESETRLKFTLAAGQLGSYEYYPQTGKMFSSERCLENFGLPADADFQFEKLLSMIHADDRERVRQAVEKAIAEKTNYKIEYRITRADGEPAWIYASGRCLYDEQETPLVMSSVTLDITNRRQSEENLRESQQRLALALQAGRAGTFEWDIKNDINIWSPEIEQLYGVPVGTFEGNFEAWAKRVVKEDAESVSAGIKAILEKGETHYEYEFRAVLPDDSIRWFAGRARFEYDSDNTPLKMIGINVDITDVKRTQKLLLERTTLAILSGDIGIALNRREELPVLLKYCTDALVKHLEVAFARIWTLDKSGEILELQASSGLYTHLDGAHSRVPVGQFKIGRIAEQRKSHLTNEVLTDTEVSDKEWAKRENMVAFAGYPLIIEEKLVGVMCVFARQPLTEAVLEAMKSVANTIANAIERKQIEKNLSDSDERFQLVTRATNDTIWDWNLQTDHVWWNKAMQSMFGYTLEQIENTSEWWYEHIHPEDRDRVVSGIQDVIDKGDENWSGEYRFACANGTYKYIFDRGFAIHRDGQPIRMIGAMQDITDRKHIETEREHLLSSEKNARAEAEQANRMKDEFLATLSHEFRTPLSAILGWSRLLKDGKITGEQTAHAIETIERNAKAQSQLIEDILDVSRITSGKLRLDVRPVELDAVIEMTIESVRPAAEAKNIRLQRVIDSNAIVSGDPDRLQQVIWNLLSNSIKFTPKDGRVQIKLERINSHIEITVADNGIGIDAEILPYVFERFRQSDSSTTRKYGGLGLGLAIVRHLVELHGGTIHAESEGLNKGTEFIVKLPVTPLHSNKVVLEKEMPTERVHPASKGDVILTCPEEIKNLRILLVADDPD